MQSPCYNANVQKTRNAINNSSNEKTSHKDILMHTYQECLKTLQGRCLKYDDVFGIDVRHLGDCEKKKNPFNSIRNCDYPDGGAHLLLRPFFQLIREGKTSRRFGPTMFRESSSNDHLVVEVGDDQLGKALLHDHDQFELCTVSGRKVFGDSSICKRKYTHSMFKTYYKTKLRLVKDNAWYLYFIERREFVPLAVAVHEATRCGFVDDPNMFLSIIVNLSKADNISANAGTHHRVEDDLPMELGLTDKVVILKDDWAIIQNAERRQVKQNASAYTKTNHKNDDAQLFRVKVTLFGALLAWRYMRATSLIEWVARAYTSNYDALQSACMSKTLPLKLVRLAKGSGEMLSKDDVTWVFGVMGDHVIPEWATCESGAKLDAVLRCHCVDDDYPKFSFSSEQICQLRNCINEAKNTANPFGFVATCWLAVSDEYLKELADKQNDPAVFTSTEIQSNCATLPHTT